LTATQKQVRKKISKIRNTTNHTAEKEKWTPKTMTKEEQEQIIREWKNIIPKEHEEARQLQIEH
jgi:hypothetical protein